MSYRGGSGYNRPTRPSRPTRPTGGGGAPRHDYGQGYGRYRRSIPVRPIAVRPRRPIFGRPHVQIPRPYGGFRKGFGRRYGGGYSGGRNQAICNIVTQILLANPSAADELQEVLQRHGIYCPGLPMGGGGTTSYRQHSVNRLRGSGGRSSKRLGGYGGGGGGMDRGRGRGGYGGGRSSYYADSGCGCGG